MKKIFNNKKYISIMLIGLGFVIFIIGIFSINKNDKLSNIKKSIENVFFFLPNSEYNNLNEMSDYCKVSMVYGTNYLKSDMLISKDDYNTTVKKDGVNAYKLSSVLKSVKKVIGESASIDINLSEDGEYSFLDEDLCRYGNDKIKALDYNQSLDVIYSTDSDDENVSKLYVKWDHPEYNDDEVILTAKALLTIKNDDGSSDVYADNDLKYKVDTISSDNIKSKIEKLYSKSFKYVFTLKNIDSNYIWTDYKVIYDNRDE